MWVQDKKINSCESSGASVFDVAVFLCVSHLDRCFEGRKAGLKQGFKHAFARLIQKIANLLVTRQNVGTCVS